MARSIFSNDGSPLRSIRRSVQRKEMTSNDGQYIAGRAVCEATRCKESMQRPTLLPLVPTALDTYTFTGVEGDGQA